MRAVTRTLPTLISGHPHSVPWKTVAEGRGNRHPCERWILDPDPGHRAVVLKVRSQTRASASLGNPLEMQILGPSQPQCIKHAGWDPEICAYAPTQVSPGWPLHTGLRAAYVFAAGFTKASSQHRTRIVTHPVILHRARISTFFSHGEPAYCADSPALCPTSAGHDKTTPVRCCPLEPPPQRRVTE